MAAASSLPTFERKVRAQAQEPTKSGLPTFDFLPDDVERDYKNDHLGFAYADEKRCAPIWIQDGINREVETFKTLKACKDALAASMSTGGLMDATDEIGLLPEDLQRLAGQWLDQEDCKNQSLERIRSQIPAVDIDDQESQDLLYWTGGGLDMVVSLLKAGYGTGNLYDLIETRFGDKRASMLHGYPIPETDYDIYSLIVNHPTWIERFKPKLRFDLWSWGVNRLMYLKDVGSISLDDAMDRVRILNTNVFPITAYDLIDDNGQFHTLMKNLIRLWVYRYDIQKMLVSSIVDRLLELRGRQYEKEIVDQALRYVYKSSMCLWYAEYRAIVDAIDSNAEASEIVDPGGIYKFKLESKLTSLLSQLRALSFGDEKDQDAITNLQSQIESLLRQGVGTCFDHSILSRYPEFQRKIIHASGDRGNMSNMSVPWYIEWTSTVIEDSITSGNPDDLKFAIRAIASMDATNPSQRQILIDLKQAFDSNPPQYGDVISFMIESKLALVDPQ